MMDWMWGVKGSWKGRATLHAFLSMWRRGWRWLWRRSDSGGVRASVFDRSVRYLDCTGRETETWTSGERSRLQTCPHRLTASGAVYIRYTSVDWSLVQFDSVAQSCPTLCDLMNRSTPGLPVHHQLLESTQTHVHQVGDAIQPSHPLSSPSPPAFSLSQHQGLFKWVSSSHQVAKVSEFTSEVLNCA